MHEGSELTFTAYATDVDGDPLTYSLVGAPAGVIYNTITGEFFWTPTEAQGPGSYTFKVVVSDGTTTAEESITVTVNEVNAAPVLSPIGNQKVDEGTELTFTATAIDVDSPANTLTYSLVDAPTGASINTATGVFTWMPTAAQSPGRYTFKVVVSDGSVSAEESITVTVNKKYSPPISNNDGNSNITSNPEPKPVDKKLIITFETNGGSPITAQSLEESKQLMLSEIPKKEGFLFDGWYKDAEFKEKWDFDKDVITETMTLYAKWNEISSPIQFLDSSLHWANDMILELATLGIINGYPDGTFRPNNFIQRKHIALMITRAIDVKVIRDETPFTDISPNHPNYEAIQLLQKAGIIDGANGKFNPDEALTRAQLAKIIVLSFGFELENTSSFEDVSKDHWSYSYIATLQKMGIVLGDNGKFNPQEPVTRAQLAAILYRALHVTK